MKRRGGVWQEDPLDRMRRAEKRVAILELALASRLSDADTVQVDREMADDQWRRVADDCAPLAVIEESHAHEAGYTRDVYMVSLSHGAGRRRPRMQ